MQSSKEWGLKALLTVALPTSHRVQWKLSLLSHHGLEFQVEAELQEVTPEYPGPLEVRAEGGERQGETNWYQLDLLGTWKKVSSPQPCPSRRRSPLAQMCENWVQSPLQRTNRTLKQNLHA